MSTRSGSMVMIVAMLCLALTPVSLRAGEDDPSQTFAFWLSSARQKIVRSAAISPREFRGSAVTVVGFIVDRDGRVISSGITRSPGYPFVDVAALRALARAAPFKPVPADSGRQTVEITVPIHYF